MKPTGLFSFLAVTALLLATTADSGSSLHHALQRRAVTSGTTATTKPPTTTLPPTTTTQQTSTTPTTTTRTTTTTPTTTNTPTTTTTPEPTTETSVSTSVPTSTRSQSLVTITSTSTIVPLPSILPALSNLPAPSGLPSDPNNPGSNSANQQNPSDLLTGPSATDSGKTIIIVVSCIGGVIVAAGVAIAAFKYNRSRSGVDDDEILRDGRGNFVNGDPFKSTLDQYHRTH